MSELADCSTAGLLKVTRADEGGNVLREVAEFLDCLADQYDFDAMTTNDEQAVGRKRAAETALRRASAMVAARLDVDPVEVPTCGEQEQER